MARVTDREAGAALEAPDVPRQRAPAVALTMENLTRRTIFPENMASPQRWRADATATTTIGPPVDTPGGIDLSRQEGARARATQLTVRKTRTTEDTPAIPAGQDSRVPEFPSAAALAGGGIHINDGGTDEGLSRQPFPGMVTTKRPSESSDGGSDDFNMSDSDLNIRSNRPRRKGRGLKPLPENASFRGSGNFMMNPALLKQKPLEYMSVAELKEELKQYGISVNGIYEKKDLINICEDRRAKDSLGDLPNHYQPARNRSGNNNNSQSDLTPANGLESFTIEVPLEGHTARSKSADRSSDPGLQRDSGMNGGNNSGGRRRRGTFGTVQDSFGSRRRITLDDEDNPDNPQQGSFSDRKTGLSALAALGIPKFGRPGSGRSNNGSGKGSLGDTNDMNVASANVPLGMDLSGVNPNEQMGMLLQQMQQLEEVEHHNQAQQLQPHPQNWQQNAPPPFMGADPNAWHDVSQRSRGSQRSSHGSFADNKRLSTASGSMQSGPNSMVGSNRSLNMRDLDGSRRSLNSHRSARGSSHGVDNVVAMVPLDECEFDHGDSLKMGTTTKKVFYRKKTFWIIVFMVLAFVGALTGSLIIFVFDDDDKNESGGGGPSSRGSVQQGSPTTSPSPTYSPASNSSASSSSFASPPSPPKQYLQAPPSDIEGRCSPSNLPGSLPACLSVCLAAACCYPNQGEESCVDETDLRTIDACNRYRPYCDIFYDPWSGATEGVLRSPPYSIVAFCLANSEKNKEISNPQLAFGERPAESIERKRLRQHHFDQRNLRGGHIKERISTDLIPQSNRSKDQQLFIYDSHSSGRILWVPSPDETCEQHCIPARCCHAPTYVEGTIVSSTGVYTDAINGEHIVTNCQQELCSEYDKFCDNHFTKSPSASASPTNNIFPMTFQQADVSPPVLSPVLSPSPQTMSPSIQLASYYPTASHSLLYNAPSPLPTIPLASPLEIAAACSGAENEAMISSGIGSARANCIDACQNGLCCYSDKLGYDSLLPSCSEGNGERCLEYSPCLILAKEITTDALVTENTTTTSNTSAEIVEGPPIPEKNLTLICSHDSLATLAGLGECLLTCEAGSCCNAQEAGETSCYDEHPEICTLYLPCMNFLVLSQQESNIILEGVNQKPPPPPAAEIDEEEGSSLPPPASANLPNLCSFESLATSGLECYEQCIPAVCCADSSCLDKDQKDPRNSKDKVDVTCDKYQICNNLDRIPAPPPSNLDEICDRSNTSKTEECDAICFSVSCCFSETTSDSDHSHSMNTSSSSCYPHFEEICDGYAQYCNPPLLAVEQVTWEPTTFPTGEPTSFPTWEPIAAPTKAPTSDPTYIPTTYDPTLKHTPKPTWKKPFEPVATSTSEVISGLDITIPTPPSNLGVLCRWFEHYCKEACKEASCCFETSPEKSCLASNKD
eukprot:CAMPEP_0183746230 /NCGR_PEP_ID=MMETSP0737-20130205/66647_1 /TAXON_ID=385413 /ORGANISM="Thalassiosira miniscula, Strain CCMP1093" /LENGTH=1405 /DNA_ID=CAMNT_0025981917 /DNA_START=125 /DNA_END=4338 /DNA_ORIENTATION=-